MSHPPSACATAEPATASAASTVFLICKMFIFSLLFSSFRASKTALSHLTGRRENDILSADRSGSLWTVQVTSPNSIYSRKESRCRLGGGYFFRSNPKRIAAITSISNARTSAVVMRLSPLSGETTYFTLLSASAVYHTRSALSNPVYAAPRAAFALPPCGVFNP